MTHGQTPSLRVLGISEYSVMPVMYSFDIQYRFWKEGDQTELQRLFSFLDSNSMRYQVQYPNPFPGESFSDNVIKIQTYTEADYTIIEEKAQQLGMTGVPDFIYPDADFEAEDLRAIEAFQDATQRAEMLANLLGKKIERVQYIDDVVAPVWFYVKYSKVLRCRVDWSPEALELFASLLGVHEGDAFGELISQYGIWVGFELND